MTEAIPVQHESAVAVLREREVQLDSEIQTHARALELATAQRELLLDLIATLSRKPRIRAARAAARPASEPANDQPDAPAPRPSVFATPALDVADAA